MKEESLRYGENYRKSKILFYENNQKSNKNVVSGKTIEIDFVKIIY